MILIHTSSKNLPEKNYLFDVIFNEFLGLQYQLILNEGSDDYAIELMNYKRLVIKDYFWTNLNSEVNYLSEKHLPPEARFYQNEFSFEPDLPVLYGSTNIRRTPEGIECEIDIFATVYFYLTKWEEYISTDRDGIGRFKLINSYSYKNNLVHRPVVNEYVELLWNMLLYLDGSLTRKQRKYNPVITHDIDQPFKLYNLESFARSFLRNLIKTKDYWNALRDIFVFPLNVFTTKYDVGNSYNFLMDASESINAKSYFFFMNSPKTKYDYGYSIEMPFVKQILNEIKSRDHIIGYHPGFHTLENPDSWRKGYEGLCAQINKKIYDGRQHYLRFDIPNSWQFCEDNGLQTDYTLGFAEVEGFRCGTCYEYSVYNFLNRKKLKLKESPLILMDVSISEYQGIRHPEEYIKKLNNIITVVKRYSGNFGLLWHNAVFNQVLYTRKFYKRIIESIAVNLIHIISFILAW